jgi:hypothetical protein
MQLARAGVPDVQAGLLSPQAQAMQPMPQPQEITMDNPELLGEGSLEAMMANPMFLMGASILANRGNVGRGLLGGTAAWQAMRQGNEANALRRMQIQQMANPRSANITELEYLQKLGVPRDQALRYAFSGQAGYGEQVDMAGKVPYVQIQNPDGTKSWRPLTEAELGQRQQVITEEERVGKAGQEYGKQTADLRKQVNDAAMILPDSIKRTDELISELRSGKYADTGPVMGRIKELWDPDLAKLNLQAMEQALQNLQITNLAPVTVKEMEMIQQMYAGSYKTPEQNAAVLEYLNKRMRERQRRMRLLDAKMRQPNFKIENLASWADELTPFEDAVGEFAPPGGAAKAAPAPAIPKAVQKKPENMPDEVWQELLRLRSTTGGF